MSEEKKTVITVPASLLRWLKFTPEQMRNAGYAQFRTTYWKTGESGFAVSDPDGNLVDASFSRTERSSWANASHSVSTDVRYGLLARGFKLEVDLND